MTESAKPAIANLNDIPEETHAGQGRFAVRWRSLTNALDTDKLGARLNTVAPGQVAWPYHRHFANEELVMVVSGAGVLRYDDADYPLKAGDCTVFKANGPAHQIRNDGAEDLVYWCISTQITPDVFEYPDANKIGLIAGGAPPGKKGERAVAKWWRADDNVGYWEGED